MQRRSGESIFKVKCPNCGNLLGIVEGGELIVKKKGRSVVIKVWEEAEIECENCQTRTTVVRQHEAPTWNGVLDSREWRPTE